MDPCHLWSELNSLVDRLVTHVNVLEFFTRTIGAF